MSSANNHKRHTLEEEFQRRMFDAEASPAPDLWARIDHDLTVQENQDYRKRMLFYRQLAAACFVLFALTGALLGYLYSGVSGPDAAQPGIAALPQPNKSKATEAVTPEAAEAAMAAYLQRQAEPAAMAQLAPVVAAEPVARVKGPASPAGIATGTEGAAEGESEQGKGSYYNAFAGYSPYLGYSAGPVSGRGLVSGGVQGSAFQGIGQGIGTPPAGRYTQIITWESVTITFGNRQQLGAQPFAGNSTLAAKPKSFVELNEAQKAAGKQQTEQMSGKLAFEKTAKEAGKSAGNSRWSLNLAYTPTYFEQNIGLLDPLTASQHNRMGLNASGNPVNASQESYQNLSAAREEYKDKTQPAFSYAMEAKAGFRLKERLKLLVGIGYSESTARTKSHFIVRQFWQKPRSNEHYELGPSTLFMTALNNGFASDSVSIARTGEAFTTDYKYRHVSVPVGLQYEHDIAKDWFVYAAGGVAANFLIETSVKTSNQEVQPVDYSPQDEDSPFRNMQMSSNLSLGVGKRLSPNLTVALGPEVRNYFTTLVAEPEKAMAPQGKPYSLGVTMGVHYQLGGIRK